MSTTWAEVSCEVPAAMVDQLADFLVELSGAGVSIENLSLDTFSLDTLEDSPLKTVKGYFAVDTHLEGKITALSAYLEKYGPSYAAFTLTPPRISYLQEEDWANNWKAHFPPSRIGKRLVIKPTWTEFASREGDVILQLDPGMAFGTGTHPTTRLCLSTLEQIFFHEGPFQTAEYPSPHDLLDVGTGTGILAIAAAKLGAGRVVAIDIDPQAVDVARENVTLNAPPGNLHLSTTPLSCITGSFDIVIANILAEELARLAPELTDRLRPGGFLILSGILTDKEDIVTTSFSRFALTPVATCREDEWSCLTYRREP